MPDDPILILTGAPGSGKTAVASLLATKAERTVHLESDYFFHFIESGYIEPWRAESHQQNRIVMRIVGDAAAGYAGAGYFTIIDGIISPGWFFEPMRDALRAAGFRVAIAILRPPLAVAVERATRRPASRLANPAVVEQIWRNFTELGSLERHVFDSGRHTAEETAELLWERLRSGALTT